MSEPIIGLQSDHYFMGGALRLAARAYEAEEVPVGAVVVREGGCIARAFNEVKLRRMPKATFLAESRRKGIFIVPFKTLITAK